VRDLHGVLSLSQAQVQIPRPARDDVITLGIHQLSKCYRAFFALVYSPHVWLSSRAARGICTASVAKTNQCRFLTSFGMTASVWGTLLYTNSKNGAIAFSGLLYRRREGRETPHLQSPLRGLITLLRLSQDLRPGLLSIAPFDRLRAGSTGLSCIAIQQR
jgi:hypothetical protein